MYLDMKEWDSICPQGLTKQTVLELSIAFSSIKQLVMCFKNQFLDSFLFSVLIWKKFMQV